MRFRSLSILFIGCVMLMSLPGLASAEDLFSFSTILRRAALRAGETVVNPAGTSWVGIPAASVHGTRRIRVKLGKVARPENFYGSDQPISDLYRYSLHSSDAFTLSQALQLQLSFPAGYSTDEVEMRYYDAVADRWRKLSEQTTDTSTLVQSARLKKKQAIIALFEKPSDDNIVQGIASWYDWTGAACNAYPLGSRIRVTNVHTGASVESTVVSTGPFVPGRVVDLPREDFAQIANISAGLVEVTVELVE